MSLSAGKKQAMNNVYSVTQSRETHIVVFVFPFIFSRLSPVNLHTTKARYKTIGPWRVNESHRAWRGVIFSARSAVPCSGLSEPIVFSVNTSSLHSLYISVSSINRRNVIPRANVCLFFNFNSSTE